MNNAEITIVRICELEVNDLFMLNGVWRKVYKKEKDNLTCKGICKENKATFTITSKSKLFVQAERYTRQRITKD
jgi:hypothetical protein